jgi:hypothetical protein
MKVPTLCSKASPIALVTLFVFVTLVPVVQAQAGGFRIAGNVVSSTSGAPLSQARVTIANVEDRSATTSLITGDDGAFAFTNLAAGKYSLAGARRGFIQSFFNQHENYATAIVTGGAADSEHLVFRLTPQAVLTGHVFDEAGDPVRKASVSLYREDRNMGAGLTHRIAGVRTDDRGIYEFAELPAGTYFLSSYAKPWYALHPRSFLKPDGTVDTPAVAHSFDVTYATTYYPDALDSDEGTPIPLRGGERLSVDIHLSPVPALRIVVHTPENGGFDMPQLLRKSFDSMDNITTQIMEKGDPGGTVGPDFGSITMLGQGTVELSGIPPGKYTVLVPDNAAGPGEGGLAEIDLNRNGQELTPSSGAPVSRLRFAVRILGQAPIPQGLVVALQNGEHKVVVASRVDEKGDSEFVHIPPGNYNLLAATPVNDYAVTRIVANGSPSKGHHLEIGAGSTIEGTVTLVGGQTIVQGIATRAGKGVPGAMIVMVPKDPESNGELFRRDQSDLDGSFSLGTVIPSEYTIVAIENGWDLNWSQPGVIAHYVKNGRKVVIPPTAQEPIRLSEPVEVQRR